jgi:hypothetical protein
MNVPHLRDLKVPKGAKEEKGLGAKLARYHGTWQLLKFSI